MKNMIKEDLSFDRFDLKCSRVLSNIRLVSRENNIYRIPAAVVAYYLYCKKKNIEPVLLTREFSDINWTANPNNETLKTSNINWTKFDDIAQKYDEKTFVKIIASDESGMAFDEEKGTPISIVNLANALLDIQEQDNVVDMGCGHGNFILNAAQKQPKAIYFGYDISRVSILISKIREEIFKQYNLIPAETQITIQEKNVFALKQELSLPKRYKFEKIFFHYPYDTPKAEVAIEKEIEDDLSTVTFANWSFNYLICCMIKNGGKGVAVMPNGSTVNYAERNIRKRFLEQGFIEAVIALPDRMFEFSPNINSLLIIFSDNPNNTKGVYMYKGQTFHEGGRQNIFTKEDIDKILNEYHSDKYFVSIDKINENNGYNLHPNTYINDIDTTNTVSFKDLLAKEIKRSNSFLVREMSTLKTEEDTNCFYLNSANIKNGIIDDNMVHLKEIPEKSEESVVTDGTLLITKNAPYKIAYVEKTEGRRILANGNFYLINLNASKVNPYFVKAFLESKKGMSLLEIVSSGSFVSNISINALESMPFPDVPLIKQKEIGDKYKEAIEKYKEKEAELKKVQEQMANIRDNMLQ